MLEPYEWKRSRTVLRRERASNRPDLVDKKLTREQYESLMRYERSKDNPIYRAEAIKSMSSRKLFAMFSPNSKNGLRSKLYRKMSLAEYNETLRTNQLQPNVKGSESTKWLSQRLDKVKKFNNKIVNKNTEQVIVEFELETPYFVYINATSVHQKNSKGMPLIKYHYEGLDENDIYRNFGIIPRELEFFNNNIKNITKL